MKGRSSKSVLIVILVLYVAFFWIFSCTKEQHSKGRVFTVVGTKSSGKTSTVLVSDGDKEIILSEGERLLDYRIEKIGSGYIELRQLYTNSETIKVLVGEEIREGMIKDGQARRTG